MCGLVSVVTKNGHGFTKSQVEAFNDLLYIDSLRGMDSTGVYLIEKDGSLSWNKEASASPDFCRTKEHKDMLTQAFRTGRAMVGHNRAATRGVVNDENAHPFTVDNRITLVHNGTLWGDHKKLADVEVDSHAIAHVIHENGDDVEKAMQQIQGAYALIWHDYANNTLNFLRNAQRPLHYVETDSCWLWASEANMLEWILARYKEFKPSKDGVCMLPEATLTTFNFSNGSWSVDSKDIKLTAPVVSKPFVPTGGPYSHWDEDDCGDYYMAQYGRAMGRGDACAIPLTPDVGGKKKEEPPFQPKQTSTNVVASPLVAANTPRVIHEEMSIAHKAKFNMSVHDFDKIGTLYETGEWCSVECIDFNTVMKDSGAGGYFLYGVLKSDPRFLVRIVTTPEISETEILDYALNGRTVLGKVANRSWRSYYDASWGMGYGLIVCNELKEVPVNYKEIVGV